MVFKHFSFFKEKVMIDTNMAVAINISSLYSKETILLEVDVAEPYNLL